MFASLFALFALFPANFFGVQKRGNKGSLRRLPGVSVSPKGINKEDVIITTQMPRTVSTSNIYRGAEYEAE